MMAFEHLNALVCVRALTTLRICHIMINKKFQYGISCLAFIIKYKLYLRYGRSGIFTLKT